MLKCSVQRTWKSCFTFNFPTVNGSREIPITFISAPLAPLIAVTEGASSFEFQPDFLRVD